MPQVAEFFDGAIASDGVRVATRDEIKNWASGEVTCELRSSLDLRPEPGNLYSEEIFGALDDPSARATRFGYIQLAVPVNHITGAGQISILPVLPPALRPPPPEVDAVDRLSDLDAIYERILGRTARARHLASISAPTAIVEEASGWVQRMVDVLFANAWEPPSSPAVMRYTGPNKRRLVSLRDLAIERLRAGGDATLLLRALALVPIGPRRRAE
jgi:DNA-directed RNA polymerase beta' subunit